MNKERNYIFNGTSPEEPIKALQYTGEKENIAAVLRFVGGGVGLGNKGYFITIPTSLTPNKFSRARYNDWIVLSSDGKFYVLPNNTFQKYYESA